MVGAILLQMHFLEWMDGLLDLVLDDSGLEILWSTDAKYPFRRQGVTKE